MKTLRIIIFLIIVSLFALGTLEAFTSSSVLSRIEGIIMYVASYALLFLSSRHNLLPPRINQFIEWATNTTDND